MNFEAPTESLLALRADYRFTLLLNLLISQETNPPTQDTAANRIISERDRSAQAYALALANDHLVTRKCYPSQDWRYDVQLIAYVMEIARSDIMATRKQADHSSYLD